MNLTVQHNRLQELLEVAKDVKTRSHDEVVPASSVTWGVDPTNRLVARTDAADWLPTSFAQHQLCEKLGIPQKYADRMREEAPKLWLDSLQTWTDKQGDKEWFLRGIHTSDRRGTSEPLRLRAILTDRYRVIDNVDALSAVLNEMQHHGADANSFESGVVDEQQMHVKIRSKDLSVGVMDVNDLVVGGFMLSNSEVGDAAIRLEPRIYRVACRNGLIIEQAQVRQVHLGNAPADGSGDDLIYRNLRASVRDVLNSFGDIVEQLRNTTEMMLDRVEINRAIKHVVREYALTEQQEANILIAFGQEPLQSKYGVIQAVTRAAQEETNPLDAIELERIGGRLVHDETWTNRMREGIVRQSGKLVKMENWLN